MLMRAVIFINGQVDDPTQLTRWLRDGDLLIGADGGTRHCLALGLTPHLVVGDLDSLEPALVAKLAAQGVTIQRHSPIKDETDLELALDTALAHKVSEVLLLGALGGRLDHMIANVLLLAKQLPPEQKPRVPVWLVEGDQLAQVVRGGECITLRAPVGSTVSLLPLSLRVTGITYSGLAYPLVNASLRLGSARGMSNVVTSTPATVQITTGVALVVQTIPMPNLTYPLPPLTPPDLQS